MDEPGARHADEVVATLARLYREHPAWCAAAALLDSQATSAVWFTHRPGDPWQLVREGGVTVLRPGRAPDPDLVFRFPPGAVEALAAAGDDVADFAIRLFELMIEADEERHVGFRVAAPFSRLVRRGYVRLLVEGGGQRVAAFAARHGIRNLGALRKLIAGLARMGPFDWERET